MNQKEQGRLRLTSSQLDRQTDACPDRQKALENRQVLFPFLFEKQDFDFFQWRPRENAGLCYLQLKLRFLSQGRKISPVPRGGGKQKPLPPTPFPPPDQTRGPNPDLPQPSDFLLSFLAWWLYGQSDRTEIDISQSAGPPPGTLQCSALHHDPGCANCSRFCRDCSPPACQCHTHVFLGNALNGVQPPELLRTLTLISSREPPRGENRERQSETGKEREKKSKLSYSGGKTFLSFNMASL